MNRYRDTNLNNLHIEITLKSKLKQERKAHSKIKPGTLQYSEIRDEIHE